MERARDDLDALTRGLGGRHYPTPEAVSGRLTTIAQKRRVGDYLSGTVSVDGTGKPTLVWRFDVDPLASR